MGYLRELVRKLGRRELALIIIAAVLAPVVTKLVDGAVEVAIRAFDTLT